MKKSIYILSILFLFILQSCVEDEEMSSSVSLDITSEASIETSFEEIDIITEAGMTDLGNAGREQRDPILECAEVTKDTVSQTIVIDYGDGCEGPNGRIRSGKILISYSDRRYVPGATRVVTFDGFSVDSVAIEGTRTVTNVSESTVDNPSFRIVTVDGKLTFTDGTFITRNADHTRTWYREELRMDDYAIVIGTASGVNRDGLNYSAVITNALVFKRACRAMGILIPVEGLKTFTLGDQISVIDYGDGSCDSEVTITRNGETSTQTLTPRGRRSRRG